MRALDPRLLHRTRSARPLLATDAVLGIATALMVLLQAACSRGSSPRAFSGVPLSALGLEFGLLVGTFALRGGLTWGMEVAGRRAAWSVLSELRLALVERRLRAQPTAADGAEVRRDRGGRRAGHRGRWRATSPATCRRSILAVGRPAAGDRLGRVRRPAVRADHAADAAARARLHVAHRPRTPSSAHASGGTRCARLSTHFLDVVRGLPTLRAFNRADDAGGAVADVERALPARRPWRRCG